MNDPVEFAKQDVLSRLAEVEKGLEAVDPRIPVHLMHIQKSLQQYEELVHMLDDKEVRILMAGLRQHKKVELVKEVTTSKGRSKALSKTTLDDI